jgi:UDP-glucose 4-epimerase
MLVHNYAELYGQRFTILRYGIPFGPRMRPELVIPRFVHQCLAGRPITVNGDGSQYRNYVWIGDLIDGHLRSLAAVAENQVINLEGTTPISVRDVAETVTSIIGGPTVVTYVPTRLGDYTGKEVSAAKARRLLGWQASTPFADGMVSYIDSCRAGREPPPIGAP